MAGYAIGSNRQGVQLDVDCHCFHLVVLICKHTKLHNHSITKDILIQCHLTSLNANGSMNLHIVRYFQQHKKCFLKEWRHRIILPPESISYTEKHTIKNHRHHQQMKFLYFMDVLCSCRSSTFYHPANHNHLVKIRNLKNLLSFIK